MNGRLARALAAARVRAERAGRGERFDFQPRTWLLPDDLPEFHDAARRMPGNPFIWRHRALAPPGRAGILAYPIDAGADARYLVQEYIAEPHLLDGYKYTLRFFIAVTSLEPLCAWISEDGFCRFAAHPFVYGSGAWHEKSRHVTTPETLVDDPTVSPSWQNTTLSGYRARLRSEGLDDAGIFEQIERLLQTTLLAAREPMVRLAASDGVALAPGQFELFAADVALDESLKPWLLGFHANPSLSVGKARNLPVAAREEVLFERLAKDLLQLVGALSPEAPAPIPSDARGLAAWLEAQESRRASYRRLFPTATSAGLLSELERLPGCNLLLAALARPPERRVLVPCHASALPLDGGLLVSSERGRAALLDGDAALLWQAVARGESLESLPALLDASVDAAEREKKVWDCLAAWVRQELIAWELPALPAPCAPTRWNGGRMYEVDGLRILVRGGGPEIEALLHPLLAPFERAPSGAPARVYDLVNHDDGWALFDGEGKRRWRGTDASLGATLLSLIEGEAMRAGRRLGAFEALLLRERRVLLVPARGLFRGLAEALAPLGLETIGAPIFINSRKHLELAESAAAAGVQASQVVCVEVDRAAARGRRGLRALCRAPGALGQRARRAAAHARGGGDAGGRARPHALLDAGRARGRLRRADGGRAARRRRAAQARAASRDAQAVDRALTGFESATEGSSDAAAVARTPQRLAEGEGVEAEPGVGVAGDALALDLDPREPAAAQRGLEPTTLVVEMRQRLVAAVVLLGPERARRCASASCSVARSGMSRTATARRALAVIASSTRPA